MSRPQSFIVDGIVASVKNQSALKVSWNRTALSLRLLNKHWCHEMNRHIDAIEWKAGPPEKSIHSLLKFTHLTSLDISNFSPPEKSYLLTQTVRKIPRLDHLQMQLATLRFLNKDDLEGLVFKSVFIQQLDPYPPSLHDLLKLAVVRTERIDIDPGFGDQRWIYDFLAIASSVKRLGIQCCLTELSFEALTGLEELELRYRGNHLQKLATLTSLVCLELDVPVANFEPFKLSNRLRVLTVVIAADFIFDQTFYDVVSRLKETNVTGSRLTNGKLPILPRKFWEVATGIEKLSLHGLVLDINPFKPFDFEKMQSLSLAECDFKGETIPWCRLTSLTSLVVHSIYGMNDTPVLGCMDLSPLKKLRRLYLESAMERDVSSKLLQSIEQLKNLEDLQLWFGNKIAHVRLEDVA